MQNRLTFTEAVNLTLTDNYCNFEGRASRSEFWWWTLFCIALMAVESMAMEMLGHQTGTLVAWIINIGMVLPTVSLLVRRLHDIGRSGWWSVLGLVPIAGLILIYWLTLPSRGAINPYGVAPFCDFD